MPNVQLKLIFVPSFESHYRTHNDRLFYMATIVAFTLTGQELANQDWRCSMNGHWLMHGDSPGWDEPPPLSLSLASSQFAIFYVNKRLVCFLSGWGGAHRCSTLCRSPASWDFRPSTNSLSRSLDPPRHRTAAMWYIDAGNRTGWHSGSKSPQSRTCPEGAAAGSRTYAPRRQLPPCLTSTHNHGADSTTGFVRELGVVV